MRLLWAWMRSVRPSPAWPPPAMLNLMPKSPCGQTAYAATKAAVIGMTLPMARDLAAYGVRVVTIAPGVFNTPLAAEVLRGDPEAAVETVPFPKRAGKPAEFGKLALHICENPMLNGEVIRLDAGLRAT